jgi:hypothetical protein
VLVGVVVGVGLTTVRAAVASRTNESFVNSRSS